MKTCLTNLNALLISIMIYDENFYELQLTT